MISPQQIQYLSSIRAKSLAGTVTLDEYKEAIKIMRGDRQAAAQSGDAAKRAKAKKEIPSVDTMLDDLMGGS